MISTKDNICKCVCHKDNMSILHAMACCQFTYQKYIRSDYSIDMERFEKLEKELENENNNNGSDSSSTT